MHAALALAYLPSTQLETARHEAAHALSARLYGFELVQMRLTASGGDTVMALPFSAEELPTRYRQYPHLTAQTARHVVAVASAGAVLDGKPLNRVDRELIATWDRYWPRSERHIWAALLLQAQEEVATWLSQPATKAALDVLARRLIHTPLQCLSGAALQAAIAAATGVAPQAPAPTRPRAMPPGDTFRPAPKGPPPAASTRPAPGTFERRLGDGVTLVYLDLKLPQQSAAPPTATPTQAPRPSFSNVPYAPGGFYA